VKVLRALRGGNGPTENFPAYLATAVRRVAWAVTEDATHYRPTEDLSLFDDPDSTDLAGHSADLRDSAAGAALAALPRESRSLLWRIEVEGHRIGDIARETGKTANSVSAATCRARKRLRSEYLRQSGAA
jgi:DNA-directed RNA polymerase specialized sigma24 family protein